MADEDDIRIRAELENAVSAPAEAAAESIEELGNEALASSAKLKALEESTDSAADSMEDLSDSTEKATDSTKDNTKATKDQETQQRKTKKSTDEQASAMARLNGVMAKIKGSKFDFAKILKAYKIPAIIAAVSLLATTLSALGAAAIGGASSLAPLGLLFAALPGLIGAVVTATQVWKAATTDVGTALEALSGDLSGAELREALEGLSPPAVAFARELKAVKDGPVEDLQNALANELLPYLSRALANVRPAIRNLTPDLTGMATTLGTIAENFSEMAASPWFQARISRILQTNNTVLGNLGAAGQDFVAVLVMITDAFRPVLRQMSQSVEASAQWLRDVTRAGHKSGEMTESFREAWAQAKRVGAVLADFAVGIYNVGREGQVMGDHLGRGIERAGNRFREWSGSLKGKSEIRAWFEDSIPVTDQVIGLIGDIIQMFARLSHNQALVPVIQQIRNELLPAIENLMLGVTEKFGPAIVSFATAWVNFTNAITFDVLADMLQMFARTLQWVVDKFNAMPEPIQKIVAQGMAFALAFGAAALVLGKVISFFGPLIKLIGVLINVLKAARVMFAAVWATALGPVAIILAAVAAVIAIGVLLYKKWAPFRELINTIWAVMRAGAQFVWDKLKQFVAWVIGGFVGGFLTVKNNLGDAFGAIKNFALDMVTFVVEKFKQITTIGQVIVDAIKAIPGKLKDLGGLFLDAGKALIGALGEGLMDAGTFLVDIGTDLVNWLVEKLNELIPNELAIPGPNIDLPNDPIPYLAKGGPVKKGQVAVVNEVGREGFVSTTGSAAMIGRGKGPQIVRFPEAGTVIPANVAERTVEQAISRRQQSAQAAPRGASAPSGHSTTMTVQIMQEFTVNDEFDVVEAARQAAIALERDLAERGISWRRTPGGPIR